MVDRGKSLRRLVLAMQNQREIVPGGHEAWRKLHAVTQQHFRICVATQTRSDLGKHPQRRDVGGLFAYLRPQQRFCLRQSIIVERGTGGAHARVARGALDVLRIGEVRVMHIADVGVHLSEAQPCGPRSGRNATARLR